VRLRLRTLLLGLTSLAILGVTLGELALTYKERGRAAEARLVDETKRLMAAGTPLLLNALIVGDLATAEQTLRELNRDVVWRRVVLYEPDGLRTMLDASPSHLPPSNAPALMRHIVRLERSEHRLRIASDPVDYAVLAVTPASHRMESEVWAEIRADLTMQAVLMVVLLVVINVILARGLRPVQALAASAARFGAGDLGARMPETRFVEIAPTVGAFNTMAENLQQREEERREAEQRQSARFAVTRILADADETDTAVARVVEALGGTLGWDRGECWLVDPEADLLRCASAWRRPGNLDDERGTAVGEVTRGRGVGLVGRAWDSGQPQVSTTDSTVLAVPLPGTRGVRGVVVLAAAARGVDDELLAALADAAGRIGLFLERKEADEALRRAEDQLRQALKMEAVGKLAGGVAHDFNNLLTVILGRCTILLPRLPEGSAEHRGIALIHQTAQRAAGLTRQLLAFSRKQVLKPQALDLTVVVDDITPMLRRLIGENVELATRLAPGVRRVRADLSQIEQVIVNLAVNARDAMPNGGRLTLETREVELDAAFVRRHEGARVGPHVQLTVRDTGIGMDGATLSRIFEPFFTTKGPGQGTGLGLSTVYGIVRQSGGCVWVESQAGEGATFGICLPVYEEPAAKVVEAAVPPPVARGWETVLLVEDEPAVRELAAEILRDSGYRVLEAENPDHALRVAAGHGETIHLLLTDVVMPGASGRDLVDRLMPLRPGLKVLYMSGYTDHAIVHHGVLDPGVAYMAKPFTPDEVTRRVREMLDDEPVPASATAR
jgi:signal transduction histidine kinase/ActR/RegA family two-component response regulator